MRPPLKRNWKQSCKCANKYDLTYPNWTGVGLTIYNFNGFMGYETGCIWMKLSMEIGLIV